MKKITLKNAKFTHLNLLLKWRNLKSVLKNSNEQKKVRMNDHKKWFRKQLDSKNIIKLVYFQKVPIGVVRLELKKCFFLISYLIIPKFRGKGYGAKALKLIMQKKYLKNIKKLVAIVKKDNTPSIRIFSKLNFKQVNVLKKNSKIIFEYLL